MDYKIKTIASAEELKSCPVFQVDQYNWGGDYRPKTYGSLGFVPEEGFCMKMFCEEKNPITTYKNPNDPVYLDSAMEGFFTFYPGSHTGCYLNFEANANSALHAKYGYTRKDRKTFPSELHEACKCKSTVFENYWTLELCVPLSLIQFVYGQCDFKKGDVIGCNFFKIKESEGLTHFGSFTKIVHETPLFHLPEYFAKAVIE